ncbi:MULTISPECIES: Lrp/AsnC family transcriptional regulator [Falsihalocynthiibacter]|uniref:Lrp/AsnC family transcriptional regulator n=1 Tax=Falsihalocynthiibacter TaxID=2854182 RepID=UPI0009ED73FC
MAVILGDLDSFDSLILRLLSRNGRLSVTDLAREIGLSKTPTQVRLKRLEVEGYITGYQAIIDPIRLGRDHVAFVEVRLTDTRESALKMFNLAAQKVSEIEECHMLASQFDYLLKVRTQNMQDFRKVLGEDISALPFVAHTSTHVAMETVKEGGQWSSEINAVF